MIENFINTDMCYILEMEIRALQVDEIDIYLSHLIRHMSESGQPGTPIFSPFSSKSPWNAETRRMPIIERWKKPVGQSGWERAWAVYATDKILGHLDLKTSALASELHRGIIGMGLEKSARNHGMGSKLLDQAIRWAKDQTNLVWLDLNVFANNEPALALYKKSGFVETGRLHDRFRVDGQSIDDISMVLKIR